MEDYNKLIFKHHYYMNENRVISARSSLEITETIIEFSYNLYKYIGNGFQCFFNPDNSSFYYNLVYYPNAEVDKYSDAKQSFYIHCNWQCLKALVIEFKHSPCCGRIPSNLAL